MGAILFAVCRGKYAEGANFPDDECRAVVIIGVPYECMGSRFIIEK